MSNWKKSEYNIEKMYEDKGFIIMNYKQYLIFISQDFLFPISQKILVKNYEYINIWGGRGILEFFDVYNNLGVECKHQDVEGTAREKIFYTGINLASQSFNSKIVFSGTEFNESFIKAAQEATANSLSYKKQPVDKVQFLSFNHFEQYLDSML